MARKKKAGHGGHGWFVTFADLMALLMSFFVMLTAMSTQDSKKLQVVAGSMAEAFGTSKESRYSGIVELDGVPTRPNLKNVQRVDPTQSTDHPEPRRNNLKAEGRSDAQLQQQMTAAAESIRQALQGNPDIAELSSNVVVKQDQDGVRIELVDQDGRSMFDQGSTEPNERTRSVLSQITPVLLRLPNRLEISGHTAWNGVTGNHQDGEISHWRLSSERALSVQEALTADGVPEYRFASVSGKGDGEPAMSDDPSLSVNRRVSIHLLPSATVLPSGLRP